MSFKRWIVYLKGVSLFFAVQGLAWAFVGSFDPFGLYDSLMAQAFFQRQTLPADAERVFGFILAPFGATTTGYFILQYFITKYAYAEKQKWAYEAIAIAFLVWFVIDTSLSFYHRAYFNIYMANIPALFLMIPVLLYTRKYFD